MKNLSCMYTNADTLTNKMTELKAYVEHHNPCIIAVTEIIPKNYEWLWSESCTIANNKLLNNLVKETNSKGYTHLLTMGDFNYKGIMWDNWNTPTLSENSDEFPFIENLRDCYLHQHITKPTRIRQGQEPSILDLIITNEEGMIKDLEYLI